MCVSRLAANFNRNSLFRPHTKGKDHGVFLVNDLRLCRLCSNGFWLCGGEMTNQGNLFLSQYGVGDRVELAPHTDAWLAGDRYGEVIKIGRFYLHIKMDRSGKVRRMVPENMTGKVQ